MNKTVDQARSGGPANLWATVWYNQNGHNIILYASITTYLLFVHSLYRYHKELYWVSRSFWRYFPWDVISDQKVYIHSKSWETFSCISSLIPRLKGTFSEPMTKLFRSTICHAPVPSHHTTSWKTSVDFVATPLVFTIVGLFPLGSWLSSANLRLIQVFVYEFPEHLVPLPMRLWN